MKKELAIPELCLVALVGASGSGKSTFAKKHFLPTEVISSDVCRALVSDDDMDMAATSPAFELVHEIARKRLAFGKLAVIDATNVQSAARKPLITLAKEQDCLPVAIVLDLPERECQARNKERGDKQIPEHAIRNHARQLRSSLKHLKREGFRYVFVLKGMEEIDAAEITRQPLWNDKRSVTGPFDIIGDVHGCFDELIELLEKLGYKANLSAGVSAGTPPPVVSGEGVLLIPPEGHWNLTHPDGRIPVFLGDIGDRGPKNADCFQFVMDVCENNSAFCVCGNHDAKLLRKLNGKNVQITHGLDRTIEEIDSMPPEFSDRLKGFLDGLISHYVFDGGRLVVAHAGLIEPYQGRSSARVRDFCLYGDTSGETDEYGLPVRYDWASDYRGKALVVYGHTPVPDAQIFNRTACIDTGCVFGGSLTALRYPEGELVSVPAAAVYYEPVRPLETARDKPLADCGSRLEEIPEIEDVLGKRLLNTRLAPTITIREENAMAALETMSRFAADPRWLIYLPPTMSPCETSAKDGLLEHPAEAFKYFGSRGVGRVVCEQKHMGSRAVVIVCRDESAARTRFGTSGGESGICYTRTGRRFFDDETLEEELLSRVRARLTETGFFDDFNTDWVCLDCELMPWSAKAQGLLKKQYAPTGVAGREGLAAAVSALEEAIKREYGKFDVTSVTSGQNADLSALLEYYSKRAEAFDHYIDAWREYCWPVTGLEGIRLAPFHLLATEGKAHVDKDHVWHMETIRKYAAPEPASGAGNEGLVITTPYIVVDTTNEDSIGAGIAWWEELTGRGGEGMVVKPYDFIACGARGVLQPAVKCRGAEYLRIIYGPEYLLPENLERLKKRSLAKKQSLALKEFSLGVESLERFCRNEPFYRVHECVFGVLAMESEPVDPRL